MSGKTLAAAAAAAGMSERTARTWQRGALPSTAKAPRTWRTREDPFADVWQSEVVPQLVADTDGRLQALTLFKVLCRRHPGRFQAGQLRTLQRRVRDWRVQYGPDREVYFEQVAVPGREAAFDFTDASDLGVTIRGVAFPHLLFEWVLSYSKWTYVGLALSETFEALVSGLQGALWMLGAVPAVLRHDNLSAATHELKRSGGRQLTARFQQVMDHYGLRSSRIQPGKPHENGVAEAAWEEVVFGELTARLTRVIIVLEYDSLSGMFPRDDVKLHAAVERLSVAGHPAAIFRPRVDAQAFKGVGGQAVLAARVLYEGASAPLPPYERSLLGGLGTLRGWEFGARVGDRLLAASIELRLPLSSPLATGKTGFLLFYDTAAVWNDGSVRDQWLKGVGVGVFLDLPVIGSVRFDVGHDLRGGVVVHSVVGFGF